MISLTPRVRNFWAVINFTSAEVTYREYFNSDVIIVEQADGAKASGRVTPTNKNDGPRYSFTPICRGDLFKQVAEVIAINLNINRPLFLYLRLKDYGAGTVIDLIDILEYVLDASHHLHLQD
ncbi:hypothetical protein ILUMI_17894 [Ignelater luminosus]|uniref:Uncharacterized protein n=1 Tax=Ignelater luminosus TaxID=2038154 RepID=A0A8K0CJ25_IGNLU|nr:hypothetical protein ILUMI_17894 [Ignelater luminosus]